MFLRKYNLAIFIHGCFWHRHSGCKYAYTPKSRIEFWNQKFAANQHRDNEVKKLLIDGGYRILIIWECAIKQVQKKNGNPSSLFDLIENTIRSETACREVGCNEDF